MFRKQIKKNQTKITFDENDQDEAKQEILTIKPTIVKRTFLDEDQHKEEPVEPILIKKLKPSTPNIPRPQEHKIQKQDDLSSFYSTDYLLELEAQNQRNNKMAQEHMVTTTHDSSNEEQEKRVSEEEFDKVRQQVIETLDEQDDHFMLEYIRQKKEQKQKDFLSFDSRSLDANWTTNTDRKRIPVVGEVKESRPQVGGYDTLPSGSDDDEFNNFEQSIIKNNASAVRKAQMRAETIFQENGYKQFGFNNKQQRQSGDQKLFTKVQLVSFEQTIKDVDTAIQVDDDFIKRIQQESDNVASAIQSSENFLIQWEQQLKESTNELVAYQEELDYFSNLQDMAKEKIPILFKAFDEIQDICDEYVSLLKLKFEEITWIPTQEQLNNLFQGQPLFLLADYGRALKDVFIDVDDTFLDVNKLAESLIGYLKKTNVSQDNIIRYSSQIVYPFFKYHFLVGFLRFYVNTQQSEDFGDDLFSKFSFDPVLLSVLIQKLMKTTYNDILKIGFLNQPIIQALLSQTIKKTYLLAKEQGDTEYQKQSLALIKLLLESVIENNKQKCGWISFIKIKNLLRFKSLLPDKNLKEAILHCQNDLHLIQMTQDQQSILSQKLQSLLDQCAD